MPSKSSSRPSRNLDVARRAGVSPATVSRVLNNADHAVSARVRRRVLDAARELGYFPNMLARSLIQGRTSAVGLLIPDVSNPYYAVILRGIEDVAAQAGWSVFLCNTDRQRKKQQTYLRTLLQRRVDGLIVAGGTFGRGDLAAIRSATPVVTIGRHAVRLPCVRVDNALAARRVTEHLLHLGHRRIACLTGPVSSAAARDRRRGYVEALRTSGLDVRGEYICHVEFSARGGEEGARMLLGLPERPTAIVAGSDQIAVGTLRALRNARIPVPQRMSVAGFDDTPSASYTVPALTSVAIPMAEMGRRAMQLVLALRNGGAARSIILPTALVVRESTAPPAHDRAGAPMATRPALRPAGTDTGAAAPRRRW